MEVPEIHEQLYLEAEKKLEALSETILKIHDLKKESAGESREASVDVI